MSIYLFLFKWADGNGTLRAIGYRFETRHGSGGDAHDYYHAQPVSDLKRAKIRHRLPCPGWIPDEVPAFPLRAENPIELLLCTLVSMYGPKFCDCLAGMTRGKLAQREIEDIGEVVEGQAGVRTLET